MATNIALSIQADNRDEVTDELLEAERVTEEAWQPRPAGTCCRNVWRYYFCCTDANGEKIPDAYVFFGFGCLCYSHSTGIE